MTPNPPRLLVSLATYNERDNLPPLADWPALDAFVLPSLAAYPAQINAAAELLDRHVRDGRGARQALWFEGAQTTAL